jgi:mevalonate kinase
MVIVSAPGKIHLMGEHAVVYGKPALLAAVNRRLSVSVTPGVKGIKVISTEPSVYIRQIATIVLQNFRITEIPGVTITVTSDIPAGFHLGSSAAAAVATIGALTYFLKKIWNPALINKLAYEAEKIQHGNPSGGDNTAVTFGGLIWYRKELEFLKSMWQFPFKPHKNTDHFFLINTGKPAETTGEMVTFVRLKMKDQRVKMEQLMNLNEIQTKRITAALKDGNEAELLDAIKLGERTLEGMGAVSAKVLPFIRNVEKNGGAAKILGGGGRKEGVGFVLCYFKEKMKIKNISAVYNYAVSGITLGEEGVRLDEK